MNGLDNLFSGMRSSASGLMAERVRVDVIAENIANARTTRTPEGGPYRRKQVVFEPMMRQVMGGHTIQGIRSANVVSDHDTPFEQIMDPSHPDADAAGMVSYPNVNTVMEMADLITAMRAYEANLTAQENFIRMAERALELAR
jgi:flagellar basal-body rod protein FlgC